MSSVDEDLWDHLPEEETAQERWIRLQSLPEVHTDANIKNYETTKHAICRGFRVTERASRVMQRANKIRIYHPAEDDSTPELFDEAPWDLCNYEAEDLDKFLFEAMDGPEGTKPWRCRLRDGELTAREYRRALKYGIHVRPTIPRSGRKRRRRDDDE